MLKYEGYSTFLSRESSMKCVPDCKNTMLAGMCHVSVLVEERKQLKWLYINQTTPSASITSMLVTGKKLRFLNETLGKLNQLKFPYYAVLEKYQFSN